MNIKVVTFDVYSALTDIKTSLVAELEKVPKLKDENLVEIFQMWRDKQMNYLLINNSVDEDQLSYRYITRRMLDYTLNRFNIEGITEDEKEQLVNGWSRLRYWPEAEAVLSELKQRGYKIALNSNGDESMLRPLQNGISVTFDYIFSGDQAGAYKPSPTFYETPFRKLGLKRDEVLHVAGSSVDVVGAKSAGLTCAWSNRFNDSLIESKHAPNFAMENLKNLLQIL